MVIIYLGSFTYDFGSEGEGVGREAYISIDRFSEGDSGRGEGSKHLKILRVA